jgi:alkylated DNA nucleotide flippase Atl1
MMIGTTALEGDTVSEIILAELAETVGQAFLRCAEELRRSGPGELTVEPAVDPVAELSLGQRQREMVDVLRATEGGLTTRGICEQMGGYDTANAHVALRALQARHVIEEVPGQKPIRWRLAGRYRATADPYLAIAREVRPGEWTTYGDISIAARGDTMGARAVGRAAAMLEHFPNPHRVLQRGGQIPDGWKSTDSESPNPEECRRRLEVERVGFDEHGRASRLNYVAWDVLVERAEDRQPPLDLGRWAS